MQLQAPSYVVLIVEDLDRSIGFYVRTLGLVLGHRSGPFAQLATGVTRISLYERAAMAETLGRPLASPVPDAPAFELGFKVEDVDAVWQELVDAGVPPVGEPVTRPWGQRTAYLRDPDGYLIELVQDAAV